MQDLIGLCDLVVHGRKELASQQQAPEGIGQSLSQGREHLDQQIKQAGDMRAFGQLYCDRALSNCVVVWWREEHLHLHSLSGNTSQIGGTFRLRGRLAAVGSARN